MVNLYIMRHGETILNKFDRIQGWADSPLTEQGERQCLESGKLLSKIPFDAIYTSDTQRTINTAKKALSVNENIIPEIHQRMPQLREYYFGQFEGLEASPVWQNVFEVLGTAENSLSNILNTFHQLDKSQTAEDFEKFSSRIDQGLKSILNENTENNKNVLIVTHALTINYTLQSLFPERKKLVIGKNGSVVQIVFDDNTFNLID